MRLDTAIADAFAPHVGTGFRLAREGDEAIDVRLADVRALGRQPGAPREEPFILVFTGPADPILPQATYALEHAELGTLELFLVPVGRGADGHVAYEAVFN